MLFQTILRRIAIVFSLCLPITAAWASVDLGADISLRNDRATPAPSAAVADQLDALLTMRFDAAGALPRSDERRRALEDLASFASLTIEGLIQAAPSGEARQLMDARLRPILTRHQDQIAAALAAVGQRPQAYSGQ